LSWRFCEAAVAALLPGEGAEPHSWSAGEHCCGAARRFETTRAPAQWTSAWTSGGRRATWWRCRARRWRTWPRPARPCCLPSLARACPHRARGRAACCAGRLGAVRCPSGAHAPPAVGAGPCVVPLGRRLRASLSEPCAHLCACHLPQRAVSRCSWTILALVWCVKHIPTCAGRKRAFCARPRRSQGELVTRQKRKLYNEIYHVPAVRRPCPGVPRAPAKACAHPCVTRLCAPCFLHGRARGRVCGCALGRASYLAWLQVCHPVIVECMACQEGLHNAADEGLADLACMMLERGSAPADAQRAGLHACCGAPVGVSGSPDSDGGPAWTSFGRR